jgi:hypothetical protein
MYRILPMYRRGPKGAGKVVTVVTVVTELVFSVLRCNHLLERGGYEVVSEMKKPPAG